MGIGVFGCIKMKRFLIPLFIGCAVVITVTQILPYCSLPYNLCDTTPASDRKYYFHVTRRESDTGNGTERTLPTYLKSEYPSLEECYRIIEEGRQYVNASFKAVPDLTEDVEVVDVLRKGCDEFKYRYHFFNKTQGKTYSTADEMRFSVAFTILIHKDLHQVASLLGAIYRSQHLYCIHVDAKSPKAMIEGAKLMSACFPNVFESSKRESVVYASFSRLRAEINCMEDLLKVPTNMYNWKYLINLCGQDYPTRTNLEMVNQLKSMDGGMCLSGTTELSEIAVNRAKYIHVLKNATVGNSTVQVLQQTKQLLDPPPYNLTIAKNIAYAVFTRDYLQWALVDSVEGKALLNWTSYTRTPDEHFWATLYLYPKSPRSSETITWRNIARAIMWKYNATENYCGGYWQHNSCVFGAGGLWWITDRQELFVNKFDIKYDSIPTRCLRLLIDDRTRGLTTDKNPHQQPMKT